MDNIHHIYTKPTCPWGKKAIALMDDKDIPYEIHVLDSTEQVEEFKDKHSVQTTPQIFSDGQRIGGFTDLANRLGEKVEETADEKSYRPVVAVFSVAALMALALSLGITGFMGFSLCLLATLKLMDLESFKTSFRNYDLITKVIPSYGFIYPFLELISGLGFLSGTFPIATGVIAMFAGLTGGFSVFKAVYLDKLDLNCACVGGNSKVPLGVISFTENVVMAAMGIWILFF